MLVLAWGGNHFTPLLPLYRDALDYSALDAGLLLAAYVLGLAPALLAGAAVSSRFGERAVLAAALGFGVAGSVLLGVGAHSFALLAAGRVLAGAGIGTAMTAGVDLIRRLHVDRSGGTDATGILRGSMTVTVGLGVGAAASGALATWTPAPALWPYLVHVLVSIAAGIPLRFARGYSPTAAGPAGFALPAGIARSRLLVVLLPAPWVFGAAAIAYASVPAVVTTVPAGWRVAYAAALTLLTLVVGTVVQPLGARLAARGADLATGVGIAAMVPGLAIAAATASRPDAVAGAIAAAVLGTGFGFTLIAGLVATRALVAAGGGRGLVGAFYAATYVGFGTPALITAWAGAGDASAPLATITVVAVISAAMLFAMRRCRP